MRTDEALALFNEWWINGRVREELAKPYRREVFDLLKQELGQRAITMVTGLRRVGKTVLIFQLIEELLKKTGARRIIYFSFDEKVSGVKEILDEYRKITGVDWKKEKIFVFLDEVQKLGGWSNQIKIIYDGFPNVKFFVSGSSSVLLEKDAVSNLAGRYYMVNVQPLTLKEFYELKHSKKIDSFELWRDELYFSFEEYVRKPFPEIVNVDSEVRIMSYIRESVIEKIIRRDLPEKFGDLNEDILLNLVEMFYQNQGGYLNIDSLSREMKIAKKTLLKHLFYLRFGNLVRELRNLRASLLVSSRKLRRIYPYHWSQVFGFFRNVDKGRLMESIVASLVDAQYYWREKNKEVDFIIKNGKVLPIEVKAGVRDTRQLLKFLSRFSVEKGLLVTGERYGEKFRINGKEIEVMPIFQLAYFHHIPYY